MDPPLTDPVWLCHSVSSTKDVCMSFNSLGSRNGLGFRSFDLKGPGSPPPVPVNPKYQYLRMLTLTGVGKKVVCLKVLRHSLYAKAMRMKGVLMMDCSSVRVSPPRE